MAHYAQVDQSNVVLRVIVITNEDEGPDEASGIAFCKALFGADTNWLKTSYNRSMRKNFAGAGFTYDPVRDAFIPPKPREDCIFDEETCNWLTP